MKFKKEKIEYANYTPSRFTEQVVLRTVEEIDEYQKESGWSKLGADAAKKYINDGPITVNSNGGWCNLGETIKLVK